MLYHTVLKHAISAVLAKEEGRIYHPVYYISNDLHETELQYSPLEK